MTGDATLQGERVFLAFLITLNLIAYGFSASSGLYLGDVVGLRVQLDAPALFWVTTAVITAYVLVYLYVTRLMLVSDTGEEPPSLGLIEGVLIVGVILGWAGFLATGYGAAETRSAKAFGFIFKLFPYDLAFALYLCGVRSPVRGFWVCMPYVLLKLLMGWTGFLFVTFSILLIRWLNARRPRLLTRAGALAMFYAAFLVAPFIFAIKFFVRYGEFQDVSYPLGLAQLVGRLTSIGNSAFVVEKARQFAGQIETLSFPSVVLLDPLLGMLPRALLGLSFENYETVYVQVVHGALHPGVIFFLGLIGKLYLCFAQSTALGVALVVLSIVLLALVALLARSLLGRAAMPFVVFAGLGFVSTGSLEELGGQVYGLLFLCALALIRSAYAWPGTLRTST